MRLEFLLEEKSMENFLRIFLLNVLPKSYQIDKNCFLRPHSGKSDLIKSIPKKVRVFSNFYEPVKLVIIHDQHSNDCIELKKQITKLCVDNGDCHMLIRIACRELEAWYLGDLDAIQQAYPQFNADKYKRRSKFRNPDNLNASHELARILPGFQKSQTARKIANYLSLDRNISTSFNNFIKGIKRLINE